MEDANQPLKSLPGSSFSHLDRPDFWKNEDSEVLIDRAPAPVDPDERSIGVTDTEVRLIERSRLLS